MINWVEAFSISHVLLPMVKGEHYTPPYDLKLNFCIAVAEALIELLHNEHCSKRGGTVAVCKIPSICTGLPLVHLASANDGGFATERCSLCNGLGVINSMSCKRTTTMDGAVHDNALCAGLHPTGRISDSLYAAFFLNDLILIRGEAV